MYAKVGTVFLTWAYYRLKPLIPWGARMALRRRLAARIRAASKDCWPIYEPAGKRPRNFPGWPEGKRFAFVLTHDVEGQAGVDRCRLLADADGRFGFRSSFNFIPEGEYATPRELREWLGGKGFEVGVHDLRHDGKLYDSRATFRQHAHSVNHYLREWDAVGFRSGFMHRRLDWLHDLQIAYDASSFDTDPFEPQPDGVHTIFPFWCKGRDGRPGYMELPYTLAQDSTMFLVLQERNIDIWKEKLAWVAERGGMALVNVHPDYVDFEGQPRANGYPAKLYTDFLEHVRSTYEGQYWHALPREVAAYARETMAPAISVPRQG